MPYVASRLAGPANVASGTSTLFTGTGAHVYTLRSIIIANNTDLPIDIKVGIDGVADADLILAVTTVLPRDTFSFTELVVLAGTETLQINASASGATATVNGIDAS